MINSIKKSLVGLLAPQSDESSEVSLVGWVGQRITGKIFIVKRTVARFLGKLSILTHSIVAFVYSNLFFIKTSSLLSQTLLLSKSALLFLDATFLLFNGALLGFELLLADALLLSKAYGSKFKKDSYAFPLRSAAWSSCP